MNPQLHPYSTYFHSLPPAIAPFFLGGLIILLLWSLAWKGFALWYSARNHQKAWFIIMLIVNTAGILEILYLLFFRKNKNGNISTTTVTHTTTTVPPVGDSSIPPAQ